MVDSHWGRLWWVLPENIIALDLAFALDWKNKDM